ncbi:hypothetical protein, partial [Candidatus Pelagibacter sp. HIMB1509]|uniref:hypothetical protein n=1 Tax=Candidatus Pelagibacter sp. HIMB1509 TaxID=3413339 RepID=UPI003F82FC5D
FCTRKLNNTTTGYRNIITNIGSKEKYIDVKKIYIVKLITFITKPLIIYLINFLFIKNSKLTLFIRIIY